VADDRHRLRRTFDSAADLYQRARPEYPKELYDALVRTARISAGDQLLEVGSASGKATDQFFVEVKEVYDGIGESLPEGVTRPRPGELTDDRAEIDQSRLFEEVVVRQFDWEVSYDAEEYLRLLDTFSGHIAMEAGKRRHLYAEIRRRLSQRPDGRLRRHWGAVLHVARRADRSSVL